MFKPSTEDLERTRKVIQEEFQKINKTVSEGEVNKAVFEILEISYSIGGGYDDSTIRRILQSLISKNIY